LPSVLFHDWGVGMADTKTAVVLGAAVTLLVGYATIIAATTQFKPATPDQSDGKAFLNTYYSSVVEPDDVEEAFDTYLDADFRRNLQQLQQVDKVRYTGFWAGYTRVDVANVKQVPDTEGFSADLVYTFRKGGKKSRPERTFFELRCPGWTAFTIVGCDESNLRIHDTHR
jgi:hypothetical protein